MRPFLVLLLVAAAGTAFFFALNSGSDSKTAPVPVDGQGPGEVNPVDPSTMTSLDGGADNRSTATSPTPDEAPETRVVSPMAKRGNALQGLVLGAGNQPVPGALVLLTRYGPTDFLAPLGEPRLADEELEADDEGRFIFRDLVPNTDYTVVASHPDHGRRTESYLSINDGEISEVVRIVLQSGSTVHGSVTDAGGQAIADAMVRLSLLSVSNMDSGPGVLSGRTSGTGLFEFRNVSEGHYSLTVRAAGFGKTQIQRIEVNGDGELLQDVTLEVAHLIAGTIRHSLDGTPIAGARVEAYSTDRRRESTNTDTLSDESGYFEFDDVRQGGYTLLVRAADYEHRRLPRIETGEVNVQIDLVPLPVVSGVVLDPSGAPVRNFTVQLRQPMPESEQTTPLAGTRRRVEAAADGAYAIACPRVGKFVVEATHPRYAPSFSVPFEVQKGGAVTGITVRMTGGGTLTGRVLDSEGGAIAGALVKTHHSDYVDDPFWRSIGDAYPSAAARKQTRTSADGSFELDGLNAESYQLHFDHPDYASVTLRDLSVQDGVNFQVPDVTLASGSTVAGTVYGPAGTAGMPGALVQLVLDTQVSGDTHGAFYKTRTNAEGRYSFQHLPSGQYKISVQRQARGDNPFVGMTDQKSTIKSLLLIEGRTYSQDFTLSN